MFDDLIDQLGISEQTSIGIALIIMIIVVIRSGRVVLVAWLETRRELNQQDHTREMKRIELEDQHEKEALQVQRDHAALLKRISDKMDEQEQAAVSRRQVYDSLATTINQLNLNVNEQTRQMRDTAATMVAVTEVREAWQTTHHTMLEDEVLPALKRIQSEYTQLSKKIDSIPQGAQGAIRDVVNLMTDLRNTLNRLSPSGEPQAGQGDQPPTDTSADAAQENKPNG